MGQVLHILNSRPTRTTEASQRSSDARQACQIVASRSARSSTGSEASRWDLKVLLRCACCHSAERQHTARGAPPCAAADAPENLKPECQPNHWQT